MHERPLPKALERAAESPPAPVAGLVPFARVPADVTTGEVAQWFVGIAGPYQGWLLMKSIDGRGEVRHIGLPWSTCALWRLGRELQVRNASPREQQAGVTPACGAG